LGEQDRIWLSVRKHESAGKLSGT